MSIHYLTNKDDLAERAGIGEKRETQHRTFGTPLQSRHDLYVTKQVGSRPRPTNSKAREMDDLQLLKGEERSEVVII